METIVEQLLAWLNSLPRFGANEDYSVGVLVGLAVGVPIGMFIESGIERLAYWVVRRRYGADCR